MQETITITLEEYKELLIIKGKYEEIKGNQGPKEIKIPKITYSDREEFEKPYKIICQEGNYGRSIKRRRNTNNF